jgi:hypothetical protein
MSRLTMKGFLFSALFLFFYKNRLLSTLLILAVLFFGMEGGKGFLLIKKGIRAKDWFTSELET